MAIFPAAILTAIKSALKNSSFLTYVDTVEILKYYRDNLPDFDTYCLIVSLNKANSEYYQIAQRFFALEVEIVALAKIGDRSEEDAMLANTPPTNVGIVQIYKDVYQTLYNNNLSGVLELYPGLIELDSAAQFNLLEEEADTFVMEARIAYNPRGQRWVDLS
jgi:hypothetical protein